MFLFGVIVRTVILDCNRVKMKYVCTWAILYYIVTHFVLHQGFISVNMFFFLWHMLQV